MRALYPRGVRARLCLAFTLTAAVVGIGGSLLFVHVVRVGIANNLDNNLEARAQTIAGVLDGTAPPKLPDPLLDAGTRAVAQATAETFAVVRRPDGVDPHRDRRAAAAAPDRAGRAPSAAGRRARAYHASVSKASRIAWLRSR